MLFLKIKIYIADIDPIESEIRELADSIFAIKAEQEYIVVRERQHRDSKLFSFLLKMSNKREYK